MATRLHNVFVYGTLKKGEPNHHWFSKQEQGFYKFLCNAKTIEKFPLIIATKYNIPFLLFNPGVGNKVRGEVYQVNDATMADLDILEDHPNYYIRELHEFEMLQGEGGKTTAWVYFIKNFKPELLKLDMLENYSSDGPHGLKYAPSEESTIEDLNGIFDTSNKAQS